MLDNFIDIVCIFVINTSIIFCNKLSMMFWNSQASEERSISSQQSEEEVVVLQQNNFLRMINLQERYNYLKSLVKVQQLNNMDELANQKSMVKIMLQLIQYYAQCISQANININNIVKYFQHKIKDMNTHYKKLFDKNVMQTETLPDKKTIKQLGDIGGTFTHILQIPEPNEEMEEQITTINIKKNISKQLMMALQNQNIQDHIKENEKKVNFLKKSMASSIQQQQNALEMRRKQIQQRRVNKRIVSEQIQKCSLIINSKIIRQRSNNKTYHSSCFSSDSELDESQSQYIQKFIIQQSSSIKNADES